MDYKKIAISQVRVYMHVCMCVFDDWEACKAWIDKKIAISLACCVCVFMSECVSVYVVMSGARKRRG